jgi:hypothetical protein
MHWTTEGAADIIALRCQHASGRWDELWQAGNARPDPLRPRHLTDSKTQTQRQQD